MINFWIWTVYSCFSCLSSFYLRSEKGLSSIFNLMTVLFSFKFTAFLTSHKLLEIILEGLIVEGWGSDYSLLGINPPVFWGGGFSYIF